MCKSVLCECLLWEEPVWSWGFEQYTLFVFRRRSCVCCYISLFSIPLELNLSVCSTRIIQRCISRSSQCFFVHPKSVKRFKSCFFIGVKPGSYFLRMRMRYECWRQKFATHNSQQFNSVKITCEYRCERRVVTSNSRQISFAFAFAGSMNRASVYNY